MIFVCAGHHVKAPGASYKGFNEYDEACLWSKLIVDYIGNNAVLVPNGVIKDKVQFINDRDPVDSIAVEIHFNSAKDDQGTPIGEGAETLYYPDSVKGRVIATKVQAALAGLFRDRGVKEGWYRMQKRFGPDYFLARTKCPAIIIEPDFIHRREYIQTRREQACRAIANALHSRI